MEFKPVCLQGQISGGPEALHQLAEALVRQGQQAKMVYLPLSPDSACHPRFAHYGVPVAHELPDREDQLIVLPETMTHLVLQFKRARLLIWWLSVDNYFKTVPTGRWRWFKNWVRGQWGDHRYYSFQKNPRVLHAYQSEYARQFLEGKGVRDALPLTDYIAPTLADLDPPSSAERHNICLYNPLKGAEFTAKVMAHCQGRGIEFVALKGLSEVQMKDYFARAKVYIDFGEHPGRDRIPREAALGGCVVLTGRLGSAANAIDVPLADEYKVDQSRYGALERIAELLDDVMKRHAQHVMNQQTYVTVIRGQRAGFTSEVAALAERVRTSAKG